MALAQGNDATPYRAVPDTAGSVRPSRTDWAREAARRNRAQLDQGMNPRVRAALEAAEAPARMERFVHETDVGNVESIRRGGIRRSRGGGAMGVEGVYAYRGGPEGRAIPEGRALIEFEADPRRILGRGTTPGSRSVALQGQVAPEAIRGGYGSAGRLFDVGSRALGLGNIANVLSGVIGGPTLYTPADWILQSLFSKAQETLNPPSEVWM